MLHKPIASEFIKTACIEFFIVAITPITMTLVVIAMTFFIELSLFFLVVSLDPPPLVLQAVVLEVVVVDLLHCYQSS